MSKDLILVRLDDEQIRKAKEINGNRKRITHGLVVKHHGIMYGTEKQCRKYYSAWCELFPHLFVKCYEASEYKLKSFTDSGNLVMHLIKEEDKIEATERFKERRILSRKSEKKKRGLFSRLFGK